MLTVTRFILLTFLMTIISVSLWATEYDESELPYVEIETINDFASLSHLAGDKNRVIMVEMSASYCGYCRTLEEEIIKPMLRSGDYTKNVLIRKLDIDSHYPMKNINGSHTSPAEIANQYDIFVTPTLIFLNAKGEEVSERILGVNSLDFYGAYVDEALLQGHEKILQQSNQTIEFPL